MSSRRHRKANKIGAYNTKGLRNFFEEVLEIFKSLDVLFLSEIQIHGCDVDLMEMVDDHAHTPAQDNSKRRLRGVAVMANLILDFKVAAKWETN